ncbi:MAG TPA: hypothetical protein VMV69_21665, partial [Pirellulales bacterium]|nr:hypothetical protein [Pirellulales bacterium]
AIHPLSVYLLLEEGIENDGWRCLPEERRLWADRITVTALRLLGHRWPTQIEAAEPVPEWADPNGIIPLTPLVHESTLSERLQQRLTADEIDAGDFSEVMGKPLDAWLATEFFKHHTKQFKKRPIAWQLQSGRFTARTSPAFAGLLYYHKLNADTLPKIRSQYVGPLKQRFETELRGIQAVAADARSDRQEKRRAELDDAIVELQKFDALLETTASSGFGPAPLLPTLRQHAIDDAMLVLKVRWLRRLSELIVRAPLSDWRAAADHAGLHPDLATWIAEAMAHLDHFCAQVGPQAPDQGTLQQDPVANDLARAIAPEAASMLSESLQFGCGVWWARFDEVVLVPLKERIKELKADQKACEERLKAEQLMAEVGPEPAEAGQIKARVKELKAHVKELTAEVREKTARASAVRGRIESWRGVSDGGLRGDEPLVWGEWLAQLPLFDQISSLDHHRAAPATIAEFIAQESLYAPDINDGVRVNIAPLQKAGLLAADVLAANDLGKAIADRALWRADERRWVREGKLPRPGWWGETEG